MPLSIIRQNLANVSADALVSLTNPWAQHLGGVEAVLVEAAGKELWRDRLALGHLDVANVQKTPGYALKASWVLHVVAHLYDDNKDAFTQLEKTYQAVLEYANTHHFKKVAFPLFATGVRGFPKDEALKIAVKTIRTFLMTTEMEITLVVYDTESYQLSSSNVENVESYLHATDIKNIPSERFMFKYDHLEKTQSTSFDDLEKTFTEHLFTLIDEKKMTDVEVYQRANLDRKLFSKIRSDAWYQPSKKTVIALTVALELSLFEAEDLLKRARYALSPSSKFDRIVEYFLIEKLYDIHELNMTLFHFTEKTLP